MAFRICLEGDPIPLQRARAGKRGFYDPQYLVKKNLVAEVKEQISNMNPAVEIPLKGAVSIHVEFWFAMPKSWSGKKVLRKATSYCEKKVDLDNCIKMIGDAFNGVLWEDDSQICEIKAVKRWGTGFTILNVFY